MSQNINNVIGLTNEQLAEQIKQGMHWLMPVLWEKLERFMLKAANSFYKQKEDKCMKAGVSVEDLIQCAYFAMVQAINSYCNKEYKFITYLSYHLLNQFNTAIGVRTEKQKNEPLKQGISLDKPLTIADDSFTLADILEDMTAQDGFIQVEDDDCLVSFWQTVETNLNKLHNQEQEECVREHFKYNKSLSDIAKERGEKPSRIRTLVDGGITQLRSRTSIKRDLEEYRELIESIAMYSSGISTFRHTWTSSVEKAVMLINKDSQ